MDKEFIYNSHNNEHSFDSKMGIIKRNISHNLETSLTHSTEYDEKGFSQQNVDTTNTYIIVQSVLKRGWIASVAWVSGCAKSINQCMF